MPGYRNWPSYTLSSATSASSPGLSGSLTRATLLFDTLASLGTSRQNFRRTWKPVPSLNAEERSGNRRKNRLRSPEAPTSRRCVTQTASLELPRQRPPPALERPMPRQKSQPLRDLGAEKSRVDSSPTDISEELHPVFPHPRASDLGLPKAVPIILRISRLSSKLLHLHPENSRQSQV